MRLTVASFKGGTAKTTTVVHLAAYLQTNAATVLLDGDDNHSATDWAEGGHLPFRITDDPDAVSAIGGKHLVVDTQARPSLDDLQALARACDLLVVPTTPDAMSLRGHTPRFEGIEGIALPCAANRYSAEAQQRRR
jgi:chromosome partitioning protein